MNRNMLAAMFVIAVLAVNGSAQKITDMGTGGGGSPHARAEWVIDGAQVTVEYGRPFLRGRTPGKDVDPYEGRVWRTGADEQTTLITDKPLKFGSVSVPVGRYGLHVIPIKGTWHLIVHNRPRGGGIPYPGPEGELGRVPMTMVKLAQPGENLTISIDDKPQGAMLHLDWGTTRASVAFTVG